MVLEISATPYIFTFKMWDWGRVGLDGVPRPIHLEHALANIQWDRDTELGRRRTCVDQVEHARRRAGLDRGAHRPARARVHRGAPALVHAAVQHDTAGTVNVLNLVEGDEAIVESPTGAFEPFVVHYAETFIVPAAVGAYDLEPSPGAARSEFGVVVASVRGTATRSTEGIATSAVP